MPPPPAIAVRRERSLLSKLPSIPVLVGLSAMMPLGMHVLLPAIPAMADEFGTSIATMQATVTVYMVAVAVGQIAYGPISDRYGRKPPLLAGIAIYFCGCLVTAFAPTTEILFLGRVVQGVGGCVGVALGRAMVRDVYSGDRAVNMLAQVAMALMVVPALAPTIGGLLLAWFDWQVPFFALAGATLVMFVACARLDETHVGGGRPPGIGAMLADFWTLIRLPAFLAPAFAVALPSAGFWAFMSLGPAMLRDSLGTPPEHFGYYFCMSPLAWFAGSFLVSRVTPRLGGERTALLAAGISALAALVALSLFLWGHPSALLLFGVLAIANGSQALAVPNLQVRLLSADTRLIGSAAGLSGFLQMALGAAATLLVAQVYDGTGLPGTAALAFTMVATLVLLLIAPRAPRAPRA